MNLEKNIKHSGRLITSRRGLEELIELSGEETSYWEHPRRESNLPFKVNAYYASLMGRRELPSGGIQTTVGNPGEAKGSYSPVADPIRIQVVPNVQELNGRDYETADPLGEGYHNPLPRLVHQYPDRVLLKVSDRCSVYCRHCFRRSFAGGTAGDISTDEAAAAAEYLAGQPGVNEILLSGGDCLALSDKKLAELMDLLEPGGQAKEANRSNTEAFSTAGRRTFRICSRMPVTDPGRITDALVELLAERKPVWVATQFNHPRELTAASLRAIDRLTGAGIPVVNQAVLLRGVNDDVETLALLFSGLVAAGVKPYYLFQGDLAAGTAHLRVGLKRGLALVKTLRRRLSGLAMPVYAVDLPGGGGKILLTEKDFLRDEPLEAGERRDWGSGPLLTGWRIFEGPGGREYRYPLEAEGKEE